MLIKTKLSTEKITSRLSQTLLNCSGKVMADFKFELSLGLKLVSLRPSQSKSQGFFQHKLVITISIHRII